MPAAQVAPSGAPPNTTANPTYKPAPPTGYSPNPTMQQYQGTPVPQAPGNATPTVSPLDSTYYDQINRINNAYNGSLANYNLAYGEDQAAYNAAQAGYDAQLPLTLQATRNSANARGLLSSGAEVQAAGANQAAYTKASAAALARWQGQQQALGGVLTGAQNTLSGGAATAYDQAVARANAGDLKTNPTSSPGTNILADTATPAQIAAAMRRNASKGKKK